MEESERATEITTRNGHKAGRSFFNVKPWLSRSALADTSGLQSSPRTAGGEGGGGVTVVTGCCVCVVVEGVNLRERQMEEKSETEVECRE